MANLRNLPAPLIGTYEWQFEGACNGLDPNRFFSPEAERGRKRERREAAAKSICAQCPVIAECREYALAVKEPYGVWGGLSETERQQLIQPRMAS